MPTLQKLDRSQINNLKIHVKAFEKQEQIKPKTNRQNIVISG